ncbi:ATPase [Chitinophagaceae bacterium IBVUCB1]|nr:ATPase [Chitinophagaceae bacterium IBVUCB1]
MNNLQFDFLVNKENNTLTVVREFAAGRQLVWDCHTKSELLEQWFAPKPFTAKTKSMNFDNGGHWHYAMVDQDGTEYWGYTSYNNVKPIDYYETSDAFSNEAGEINKELPAAIWEVSFTDKGENTLVTTIVKYNSLADLEKILEMGMKEGLTATLQQLDELIQSLKK